jgi:hypothetical protein
MPSPHRLLLTLALTGFAGPALAAQSVVGTWAPTLAACNQPRAITIGPKSLVGEDFSCRFDRVSRKGSLVTWKGGCSAGDEDKPRTVFAKRSGKKLFYRYQGQSGWNGPYVRCGK